MASFKSADASSSSVPFLGPDNRRQERRPSQDQTKPPLPSRFLSSPSPFVVNLSPRGGFSLHARSLWEIPTVFYWITLPSFSVIAYRALSRSSFILGLGFFFKATYTTLIQTWIFVATILTSLWCGGHGGGYILASQLQIHSTSKTHLQGLKI